MQGTFLSSNMLAEISWQAAKAALTDPHQHVVSVLFSSTFVEAAVNELLHHLSEAEKEDEIVISHWAREAGLYETVNQPPVTP